MKLFDMRFDSDEIETMLFAIRKELDAVMVDINEEEECDIPRQYILRAMFEEEVRLSELRGRFVSVLGGDSLRGEYGNVDTVEEDSGDLGKDALTEYPDSVGEEECESCKDCENSGCSNKGVF
jgi:hypothetical protein